MYNSAYFEHSFLAREMGVALVEGRDLIVEDDYVFMRTTQGRQRVDVIYRRIDDDFLDPLTFRRDSLLGVPGLINAYREGNVALANAPGAGVADDKAVYAFVPELIRYYLGEEPLLPKVPTYVGFRRDDLALHARSTSHELVVKTTGDSGGYGMLMGPFAAKRARSSVRGAGASRIPATTSPSRSSAVVAPDLRRRAASRPAASTCGRSSSTARRIRVLPGGLTRVALRAGSYVVNSSQGAAARTPGCCAARGA